MSQDVFRQFVRPIRGLAGKAWRSGLWRMGTQISGPFRHVAGNCWFARLRQMPAPVPGQVVICEDGNLLVGNESPLGLIKQYGFGGYRFGSDGLYFASSDNTDPNKNGRRYRLVRNPRNVFWSYRALNHLLRHPTDLELQQDVDWALRVNEIIDRYERISGTTLKGKQVLEVGPGPNYGSTLVMACRGAVCSVVDAFVPTWIEDYHPRFYRALAEKLRSDPRVVTLEPLEQMLRTRDLDRGGLIRYADAAEELQADTAAFDFVWSNATAEHFYDIEAAFRQLARVTRPGGFGVHVIDLKDHRDEVRRLEYLLLSDAEYQAEFVLRHSECGNRHREGEFLEVFHNVGLDVVEKEATSLFDPAYLQDFMPRLRERGNPRYRSLSVEELQPAVTTVTLLRSTVGTRRQPSTV